MAFCRFHRYAILSKSPVVTGSGVFSMTIGRMPVVLAVLLAGLLAILLVGWIVMGAAIVAFVSDDADAATLVDVSRQMSAR